MFLDSNKLLFSCGLPFILKKFFDVLHAFPVVGIMLFSTGGIFLESMINSQLDIQSGGVFF